LAGGVAIKTPFGTFFGPNITSDKIYGIGNWSDKDFVRAMRKGIAPDGSHYFPAFPYTFYTRMTMKDLMDLKAYVFSFPTQSRENRTQQIKFPVNIRALQFFWKKLYFSDGVFVQRKSHGKLWNRGFYLVNAITHCGGIKSDWFLNGVRGSAGVQQTSNITPDLHTGIGKWSDADLNDFLKFGLLPDGDTVGGSMAEVVENLSELRPWDLQSIIFYLNSIPKISNNIINNRGAQR
jgi:hypothetical protein